MIIELFLIFIAILLASLISNLSIYLYRRKKELDMAVVYATLIINGKKTINDVPALLKEQVIEVLLDLGLEELTR